MFDTLDKHISNIAESMARRVNRRRVITRGIKGGFALVAGLALGQLSNLKEAFAVTCTCNWAGGSGNANCPNVGGCPAQGCPSGCSICTTSSGCGTICNYASGFWVSCTGLGSCGKGYRLCRDCNCNGCNYICTCLSATICNFCCSKKELEESLRQFGLVASLVH
jgi:hypothetical protein